jgi:hypothetical protein
MKTGMGQGCSFFNPFSTGWYYQPRLKGWVLVLGIVGAECGPDTNQ